MYSPSHGIGSVAREMREIGGRWEKKTQAFRLPRLTRMVRFLSEFDPDASMVPDLKRHLKGTWEETDSEVWRAIWHDSWHQGYDKLYPYQKEAVHALATRPYHGELLTLSPGLGKTPTSIVAAEHYMAEFGNSQRILVVAPLSLLHNWEREIERWASDTRVEVCHQESPTEDRSVRWTVTNYDSIMERIKDPTSNRTVVTGNLKEEWDLDWDVVIFDESVLLKNRKAKRTQAARTLARAAKRVWLLSGAPITRDNSDIWAQFNIMEPDYFTSFWRYAEEACVVVKTQWSMGEILGSRKDFDTRHEYPEIMFVRNQEEVFEDLPEYLYQEVEITLDPRQAKAHEDVLQTWIHELEENRDKRVEVTAVIAMLTRLMQITSSLYNLETTGKEWPDVSAKADYICEELNNGEFELPALVWVHHRPGAHALRDRLVKLTKKKESAMYGKRIELVLGGMKKGVADTLIEEYKAGKIDVLLMGLTVGKFGHSLAVTRTAVYFDKVWDVDALVQSFHRVAGARAKITGYTHKPRLITLRCRGTVDDFVELNLAGKLPSIARITGADLSKMLRALGEDLVQ